MTAVKAIPDGYPQVIPYLSIAGAAAAIDFYSKVFGATEKLRMQAPGGRIGHAELQFGNSMVMLADVSPDIGGQAPGELGGTPVTIMVYVQDVDAVFERAVAAGGVTERPVEDQFYGDRAGQFRDPFGHKWFVATHVEDVGPDEMAERAAKAMG